MADEGKTSTYGFDHVGLSVRDLASSRQFFCNCLGWHLVGERTNYPAAFVSDGYGVLALWQVESPDRAVEFNRRANVGLHHLAVAVVDRTGLDTLYQRMSNWPGVIVEFSPQLSGAGPKIISWCGSRAACGSSLRSTLASRASARCDEAVRAATGRRQGG